MRNGTGNLVTFGTARLGSAAFFSITSDLCSGTTIGPTDTCSIEVTGRPDTEGNTSTTLQILFTSGQTTINVPVSVNAYANTSLTIALTGTARDAGRVTSGDGGISCPGTCTFIARRGSTVVLQATPYNDFVGFVGFDGGGCGGNSTCSLSMAPDASIVEASFDFYNRIFISVPPTNPPSRYGDFLSSGNFPCNTEPGLTIRPGHSWDFAVGNTLSSSLAGSRGWVRMDGLPFADRAIDLTNGNASTAILYSFNSTRLTTSSLWTGIGPTNCMGFATQSTTQTGMTGLSTSQRWFDSGGPLTCDSTFRAACIESGGRAPLVVRPRPPGSRLAFVSRQTFNGAQSNAVVDLACNTEAGAAPGTFVALRTEMDGGAAIGRVRLDGGNWYRPDNVPLFPNPQELANGGMASAQMLANANLHFDGSRIDAGEYVWTGGNTSSGSSLPGANCGPWTNTSSSGVTVGDPERVDIPAFGLQGSQCSTPRHVYCYER